MIPISLLSFSNAKTRRWIGAPLLAAWLLAWVPMQAAGAPPDPATAVRGLTGAHTRMLWSQNQGGPDGYARHDNDDILFGLDTDDGKGIRKILNSTGGYQKPMFTSDGERIVFSTFYRGRIPDYRIFVVGFDGKGLRELLTNHAASSVKKIGGVEWVYATKTLNSKSALTDTVIRFDLDNPAKKEIVWTKSKVDNDQGHWFNVSYDGRRAVGGFPYPGAGMATLPNGDLKLFGGGGCWVGFAPDTSLNWMMLMPGHSQILMGDANGPRMIYNKKKQTNIELRIDIFKAMKATGEVDTTVQGVKQMSWIHWTNHPDYFVVGGPEVPTSMTEAWIGRLNPTRDSVVSIVRVSRNNLADLFPDAWIDPSDNRKAAAPVIRPEDARFVGSVQVALSASQAGAQIRYTLDGSLPGPASPLYSAPITLSANTTVKARAYINGLEASEAASREYVKVASMQFASLAVSPDSASLARGGTLRFTAEARDQFGAPLIPQPTISWSTAKPNAITAQGDFTAAAGASGAYHVQATATVGGVAKTGKARITVTAADLVLLSPKGGETFRVGDTVAIRWSVNLEVVASVDVSVSLNGGQNWTPLNTAGSITPDSPGWPMYRWVIPARQGQASTLSNKCLLRVTDYVQPDQNRDVTPTTFTISASTGLAPLGRLSDMSRLSARVLRLEEAGNWRIRLYRIDGVRAEEWNVTGPGEWRDWRLSRTGMGWEGAGIRILETLSPGGKRQRLVLPPVP